MSESDSDDPLVATVAARKSQMNWSSDMVETLLNLVITKGCHTVGSGMAKETWNDLLDDLFKNASFLPFKKDHYLAGNVRFVKDKYAAVVIKCNRLMQHGNKSAMSGSGLTKEYALVKQILEEKSDAKEMRAENKELSSKVTSAKGKNESKALTAKLKKKAELKGKQVDGSIITKSVVSSSQGTSGKRPTFEDMMMSQMQAEWNKSNPPVNNSSASAVSKIIHQQKQQLTIEEEVQDQMLEWIAAEMMDHVDFCKAAKIKSSFVEDLGVELIVGAFCTPGGQFSMKSFKENMTDLEVKPSEILKCFMQLQKWKRLTVTWLESTALLEDNVAMNESFQSGGMSVKK